MEKFECRSAILEDLEILLEFEQGIITAERPFDSTLRKGDIHYYDLEQLILADNAEVAVIMYKDQIVGSGYGLIKAAKPYLDHETYMYCGFMYTVPQYRGKGVNRIILSHLKDWALTKGINEIRLTVYVDNIPAIKAYEKVGFQKHLVEMRLDRRELS
ncbi:GNAT family N-acetyltransferase [Spongiimicrobium salis]|uniref:GNAT family N-acetyltransferase n=1 Tax=Spongiimicrobium salis TaxID=1667022 RepID=UPI00374DF65E